MSDEYKQKCIEDKNRQDKMNKEVVEELEKLKEFELSSTKTKDRVRLLKWLSNYHLYSDNITVNKRDDNFVVQVLEDAGYIENDNVGNELCKTNKDICFRYIIGQAISTMKFIALHQAIINMADNWIEKYKDE